MAPRDFMDNEISLGSAVELSAIYAETADELRLAIQKTSLSRDQLARLVVMASVHLDGASSTIDGLTRLVSLQQNGEKPMTPNEQSRLTGRWEHEGRAAIRRARLQGFVLGFIANAVSVILMGWAIAP